MSVDKRELILLRLQAVLGTINGLTPALVYRNRGEFDEKKTPLPIAILLDGSERKLLDLAPASRGRAMGPSPMIMELVPEMFILTKPKIIADAAEYGPELSAWRFAFLKAIFTDGALIALLGANGGIEYRGMVTDMQTGRNMEGQLQFNFAFRYALIPSDL